MFNSKAVLMGLLLCAIFIPNSTASRAQTLVSAKVLSSEGLVEIRRQTNGQAQIQPIAFKTNDELKAGDTIVTGKKGRLVLGLSDGSQAVIAPQTMVVIQNLQQSPRTLFNVLRGKTRVHIEKYGGQPNPYRVNTPTAVIAVRGTIFDVLVKDNETEVFLHEGQVSVFNLALPDQPVLLAPGHTTRISGERVPRNPNTFKPGRNDDSFRDTEQRQDDRRIAERNNDPNRADERNTANAPGERGARNDASERSNKSGGLTDFGRNGSTLPNASTRPSSPPPSAGPSGGGSGGRRP
ncbi:MAG: FecR domain-containing protein [Acidobacteria bacterium]|nr:FecR domain-containing protein [Acidobacteriota bacterium]